MACMQRPTQVMTRSRRRWRHDHPHACPGHGGSQQHCSCCSSHRETCPPVPTSFLSVLVLSYHFSLFLSSASPLSFQHPSHCRSPLGISPTIDGRRMNGLPIRRRCRQRRSLMRHLRRLHLSALPRVPARGRAHGAGPHPSHAALGRLVQHSVISVQASRSYLSPN